MFSVRLLLCFVLTDKVVSMCHRRTSLCSRWIIQCRRCTLQQSTANVIGLHSSFFCQKEQTCFSATNSFQPCFSTSWSVSVHLVPIYNTRVNICSVFQVRRRVTSNFNSSPIDELGNWCQEKLVRAPRKYEAVVNWFNRINKTSLSYKLFSLKISSLFLFSLDWFLFSCVTLTYFRCNT